MDKTELKHPLKHLAITCRLGEVRFALSFLSFRLFFPSIDIVLLGQVNAKGTTLHIPGCNILPFSLLMLSFQSRGLEYPDEIGGQRDLLSRAALMVNLENKKQRDQKKREQEEERRKLRKRARRGKRRKLKSFRLEERKSRRKKRRCSTSTSVRKLDHCSTS